MRIPEIPPGQTAACHRRSHCTRTPGSSRTRQPGQILAPTTHQMLLDCDKQPWPSPPVPHRQPQPPPAPHGARALPPLGLLPVGEVRRSQKSSSKKDILVARGALSSKQPVAALEDSGSFLQGSCCPHLPSARSCPAACVVSQTCDRGHVAHLNKSLGAEGAEPQLDLFLPSPSQGCGAGSSHPVLTVGTGMCAGGAWVMAGGGHRCWHLPPIPAPLGTLPCWASTGSSSRLSFCRIF